MDRRYKIKWKIDRGDFLKGEVGYILLGGFLSLNVGC